jgi:hypothetical protein
METQQEVPDAPTITNPTVQSMVSVGPITTSTVLLPSVGTPIKEVAASKDALVQAKSLETRLQKFQEMAVEIYKDASTVCSNIHVSTKVSVLLFFNRIVVTDWHVGFVVLSSSGGTISEYTVSTYIDE